MAETSQSQEPRPIKRLQDSLINRIAAGEIIHRPASALKELLENSLDAGASSITVTVKDGGMKLLQIQDNGCGIRKSDLPILAERFTTSKLTTFADLSHITTYGFRGEALASISHVAHLSVVTKTKSDKCAWKAAYSDSALVGPKPGQSPDPKPCAGNDGTTITIENLFYNTPTRLSALKNTSEEYSRILGVITRYAIHNPKVAFVCKKAGFSTPELSTPSASETPHAIRLLYGHTVAKELLHLKVSSAVKPSGDADDPMSEDDPESWVAEAHFTNCNYQAKKMTFLLFINHRSVESFRMKRSIESVYQNLLPKGASPFVYLSLQIDPRSVDVNVHPTKREVHFMNEEAIIEKITDNLQQALAAKSNSRSFEYQTPLTDSMTITGGQSSKQSGSKVREAENDDEQENDEPSISNNPAEKKKVYSHLKVRTSLKDRTLDSMFPVQNPSQIANDSPSTTAESTNSKIRESECYLTSINKLRQALIKGKHRQLSEILEKHTFVGIVDLYRSLSLIQFSTKLYMINHFSLAEELFYQLGLRQFGNFSRMKLEPPPQLHAMVEIAVYAEDSTTTSSLSKNEITDRIVSLLTSKREMLSEYFSLDISEDGYVQSLPLLLKEYIPNLDSLPNFLMRLGPQVDWTSELECFDTFLRELAYFYAPGSGLSAADDDGRSDLEKAERWQIQHVLFPAMRQYLLPPKSLLDRDVVQIANLPDLYKVFERC